MKWYVLLAFLLLFPFVPFAKGSEGSDPQAEPSGVQIIPESPDGSYGRDQYIFFTVETSEPLSFYFPENQQCFAFYPPTIEMNAGNATFSSVSGNRVRFQYLVRSVVQERLNIKKGARLYARCGIKTESGRTFNSIALPDADGPDSLAAKSRLSVDGVGPRLVSIGSPNSNGVYHPGDTIDIALKFDRRVITKNPEEEELRLQVHADPQQWLPSAASYQGGNGTDTLVFRYEVPKGNPGKRIRVGALVSRADPLERDPLRTYSQVKDERGYSMETYGYSLPTAGWNKDIVLSPLIKNPSRAKVKSVRAVSPNGAYGPGRPVTLAVEFTENVVVTGVPLLSVNQGTKAFYTKGSGSNILEFQYNPLLSEPPTERLNYVSRNALTDSPLKKGCLTNICSIKDLSGRFPDLTLPLLKQKGSLFFESRIQINHSSRPKIISIDYEDRKPEFRVGDRVSMLVQFDKPVRVSKGLAMWLSNQGIAYYKSGSGTHQLRFEYIVGRGQAEESSDSVTVGSRYFRAAIFNPDSLYAPGERLPSSETLVRDLDGNFALLSTKSAEIKLGGKVIIER